uniref:Helix-turn-helix domain-containing protein n=1 Tax=Bosea sp. NBC_00436 TaxID=2969620 RepID=A0A9E7ZTI9_9HYPH
MLALRLRQIERSFPSYSAFAEKSGISRRTLVLLRNGKGNPSFKTLLTLAESFEVSVWNLLGIRDETVSSGAESCGLSDEIDQLPSKEYSDERFGDDQAAERTQGFVAQAEPPEE